MLRKTLIKKSSLLSITSAPPQPHNNNAVKHLKNAPVSYYVFYVDGDVVL